MPEPWLERFKWLVRMYHSREVSTRAAALTYYAFFTLFPLLLVSLAVLGYLVDTRTPFAEHLMRSAIDFIDQNLNRSGASDIVNRVFESLASSAASLGITGFLGDLWGISGSLGSISRSLTQILTPHTPPPNWRVRLRALGVLLLLGGSFALTILAFQVLTFLPFFRASVVRAFSFFLLPVITFTLLYRWLPHQVPGWRPAFWGGITSGILFALVQAGFALYLRFASFDTAFGPLASIAIFLLWLQFSSTAFLIGALVTAMFKNLSQGKPLSGDPAIAS